MKLKLEFGSHFCYTPTFTINGIDGNSADFGEKYDHSPETAEEYGCGNMKFTRCPPTASVLTKYNITVDEYNQVAAKLEKGLSFGQCGWCV